MNNKKNKVIPENKQIQKYDNLFNELEELKSDFTNLKNKIDNLNIKFNQFIENVEKELLNDYSNTNNDELSNNYQSDNNSENDSEYYGSEEYKFGDSDNSSDNEMICKNMDPDLAKMLGFPVDESLYKSDWIPPKFSGLANSEKIIDKNNRK